MRRFRSTRFGTSQFSVSDFRAGDGVPHAISFSIALIAGLLIGSVAPVHAQGISDERAVEELFGQHEEMLQENPDAGEPPAVVSTGGDRRLDRLFERLANAENENEARGVSLLIYRRWMRSGSDTADLLMVRAQQATRASDHALAIELLDRVLVLQPDWAEAWNRRAVTFHMLGDPVAAIADIHRVLTLEPRHFGAWAGLGHIFREGGDDKGALASYERAIAINPHIPQLAPIVEKLKREIEGVDL